MLGIYIILCFSTLASGTILLINEVFCEILPASSTVVNELINLYNFLK